MKITESFNFFKDMNNKGIIYCYSGAFSQKIIEDIGATIKSSLELNETAPSITQRIFAVFVEQVQNIMKYCKDVENTDNKNEGDKNNKGIVIVGYENNGKLYVMTGNFIKKDQQQSLQNHLEEIKSMNDDELKKLYKEQLKKIKDLTTGNPGLGIIDMARKASQPIEYHFDKNKDDLSFFTLKAVI